MAGTGTKLARGGSFLIETTEPEDIVVPEQLGADQRMVADTTAAFVQRDVLPHDAQIEHLDYGLTVQLLRRAGELGLLGAEVPEQYGGLGLDKVSTTLISERLSRASSFALSVGAHIGIGTLPIVYFGNAAQKEKYLPELVTAQKIAAYCLTEPSSGSDALGAKTTARLSADGRHWVLNGSKQFITNAGFADVFIVYATVDGKEFSTFIVERTMPGVSVGPEEKKMGIKGSSTCPLILEDVPVPVENLLWEVGKGHLIAFNILNIGRFKLAAGCLGACKDAIALAAAYANERSQFGQKISSFPLIGRKLADMAVRTFVLESMVYRTAGLMDGALNGIDHAAPDAGQQSARAIAEYALECSINKVFGSEALAFVADEGLQIHGGYGFTQEYKIERVYRDARINRIFEGTNEINRLLIPGTLLRRALKGELPLLAKVQALQGEILQLVPGREFDGVLAEETHLTEMAKEVFLLVGGLAVQKFGTALEQQQELLADLADIMILTFAMESAQLRARRKVAGEGEEKAALAVCMAQVFTHEALAQVEELAKGCLAYVETGDVLRTQLSVLKKLTRRSQMDGFRAKREIAQAVIAAEQFVY